MIRLRQTFGVHTGRTVEFSGSPVRAGRAADSDLLFHAEGDIDASGRHAELVQHAGGWEIVDVGSRNGTFLNGRRIEREAIKLGDEIEFGAGGPRLVVETVFGKAELSSPAAIGEAKTELAEPGPSSAPESYGPRTVGLMIQNAVERARGEAGALRKKPSTTLSALQKPAGLAMLAGGCLLVLAALLLFATFGIILYGRLSDAEGFEGPGDAVDGEANVVLQSDFDADLHSKAVYVLKADRQSESSCVAFAIESRMLASTASCVLALHQARSRTSPLLAIGMDGERKVTRLWRHPSYRDKSSTPSPNLAVLEIDAPVESTLNLEAAGRLRALRGNREAMMLARDHDGATSIRVMISGTEPLVGVPGEHTGLILREAGIEGAPLLGSGGELLGICDGQQRAIRADVLAALLAGFGAENEATPAAQEQSAD